MSEDKTDAVSKTRDDLRDLAESIIDAYETRVRTISGMMRQAYELVQSYRRDVENALSTLQGNMARGQSLRRRDFDSIVGNVISARARREKQVLEQLDAFSKEEGEMVMRLRRIVAHGKASDLDDLRKIQEDILTRQKSRERQVIGGLRNFEIEEHELRTALGWLLNKGQKATVAHLRSMVNALTARWTAEGREVFEAVEELEGERGRVRARWQQVVDASSGTPGSGPERQA